MAANDNDVDLTDLYDRLSLEGRLKDLTARVDDLVAYLSSTSPSGILQERDSVLRCLRLALEEARGLRGAEDARYHLEVTAGIVEAGLRTLARSMGDDGDMGVLMRHDQLMRLVEYSLGLTGSVLFDPSGYPAAITYASSLT